MEIEALNKSIYDRCLSLMTLQALVAGDARLITGILEAIAELIGDCGPQSPAWRSE